MILDYQRADWPEVCRVFDLSKPFELAGAGIGDSFVPLAKDEGRIAQFSKSTIFVWKEEGAIRGFVGFNDTYIGWLFVEPSAFRKGLGRALLRHVVGIIDGNHWLWAAKENRPAIRLYQSEGFEITEERVSQNSGMPCVAVKLTFKKQL